MRTPPSLLIGFVLLSLASAVPASDDDPWAVAEAAAISASKNKAGDDYRRTVEHAFSKDHGATLGRCAKETKKPDLSDFTLLLRIDAHGAVDSAMVKPATNLAACLEGKIKGWKIDPPPHDAFWAKLDVKLNAK